MKRTIGTLLDDPDALFDWLQTPATGIAAMNLACESGLADAVLEAPASASELARLTGIAEDKLVRIVDLLRAHELLAVAPDGRVMATGGTRRMRDLAGLWTSSIFTMSAAGALYPALREGKTPFELRFGQPVFEYFGAHPEFGARFGQFMEFMTSRVVRFLHEHHRFKPFDTVVDLGGSFGGLLLSMLEQYPGTRGILFDLPGVIAQAEERIRDSALSHRIDLVGGSFFEEVPPADLYLLKQILHDWDDDECIRILGTIRRAIGPDGRVAVMDHILSDPPEPTEGQMTDIAMMLWDTGHERRLGQFEALFEASGFRLDRVSANPSGHSVIEAAPI